MRLRIPIALLLAACSIAGAADRWQKHMQSGRKAFAAMRLSEAEKEFGEAMRDAARAAPEGVRVADSIDGLADVYIAEAKFAAAEPLLQRALSIREKALGSSHLEVAKSLDALADLYEREQKRDQAETLYARARSIRERAAAEHPDIYSIVDGKLVHRAPK